VCDDIACRLAGGAGLLAELKKSLPADTARPSPCLGLCERAPAALVQCAGEGAKDYVVAPASARPLENSLQSAPHPVPLPPGEGTL